MAISKKSIFFIIFMLAVMMGAAGCQKGANNAVKQPADKPVIAGQNEKPAIATTTEEVATTTDSIFASTTGEIDTSDWQTYRNEEFGFEVKYPEGWKIDTRETGLIEFKDKVNKVYFEQGEAYLTSVYTKHFEDKNQIEAYLQGWKKSKIENGGWAKKIFIREMFVIQGSNDFGLSTVFVDEDGLNVIIITKGIFSPEYPLIDDIYYGMINSWKFVN